MAPAVLNTATEHQDRGPHLLAVCILFSVLVLTIAPLRMFRMIKLRKVEYDDALIVFATLLNLATNCILTAAVVVGDGRHVKDIQDPLDRFRALQLPWISQPMSAFTLLFAKASVGATLLKIEFGRNFNIIVLVTIFIVSLGNIWGAAAILAGYHPTMQRTGSTTSPPHKPPFTIEFASYIQTAANIFSDLVFFIAPEMFLKNIKLTSHHRGVIRILLGFMILATVMSIGKLVALPALLHTQDGDLTWTSAQVSTFGVAEAGLSTIAACLPGIRQVFGERLSTCFRSWRQVPSSRAGSPAVDHLMAGHSKVEARTYIRPVDLPRQPEKAGVRTSRNESTADPDSDHHKSGIKSMSTTTRQVDDDDGLDFLGCQSYDCER